MDIASKVEAQIFAFHSNKQPDRHTFDVRIGPNKFANNVGTNV